MRPRDPGRRPLAIAASVLVLLGGIWLATRPDPESDTSQAPSADGGGDVQALLTSDEAEAPLGRTTRLWTVAQAGAADFANINEALAAAGPDDTIEVLDAATYSGPIVISDTHRLEGVRLVSRAGASLRGLITSGRLAVLSIHNTRRVRVEGFTIEGDGHGYHAVYLTGDVAGTQLHELSILQPEGATWANLLLARECRGSADDPLVISRCRFNSPKHGLYVGRGGPDGVADAVEVEHLLIDGNSFSGPGTHVQLTHAVRNVRIENNVFDDGDGVLLQLDGSAPSRMISLTNNTFFRSASWLRFGEDRADYDGTACNNLIVDCRSAVWDADFGERAKRWRFVNNLSEDPASPAVERVAPFGKAIRDAGLMSRDPAAPEFLKPSRGSAAATFGAGDPLPVYVGALPPDPS